MSTEARTQVARWPLKWRLRWGQRSNELERLGMPWRRAELEAFRQVSAERMALHDRSTVEESDPQADVSKRVPPTGPRPWRCERPLCSRGGWWLSKQRVLNCLSCCPPAAPAVVAKRGTAEDAPIVEPDRSTTPLGTRYEREHLEPATRPVKRKTAKSK